MKPLSLRQKQSKFARMLAALIDYITLHGYEATLAVGYVPAGVTRRASWSLHHKRLAQDLNLFHHGVYLRSTKAHTRFGIYWESLGGSWGGRFKYRVVRGKRVGGPDGNHYSLEHNGVR